MKKILVLFPNDWDRVELGAEKYKDKYSFVFYGGNMLGFPGYLRLFWFDVEKFIDRVVFQCMRERVDGILSTDEYLGAVVAAVVAKKLGLPGADPEKIILAQHKFFSRSCQRRIVPDATPGFTLVLLPVNEATYSLDFPFFLKPVKGSFSIFATKVHTPEAVRDHVHFGPLEELFLRKLIHPFNTLLRAYSELEQDASCFIGEELLEGVQVTIDGFAFNGDVEIMGVVDSVMFPGTNTFERFEYPSRLSEAVQNRMAELVKRLVSGMGLNYGQFNVEMFYNPETGAIKIIEVNPRLSYQFADLYENVDGCNSYDILLKLTLGERPCFSNRAGKYKCAASFVLRTFRGHWLKSVPTRDQVEKFGRRYHGFRIQIYGKAGQSLFLQMRALGSYRYAVINTGAPTSSELSAIYKDAVEQLEFKFA